MNNKKITVGLLIAGLIACLDHENAHASQASRRFPKVEICNAAEAGNLKTVQRLVRSDQSLVNARGGGLGETPLHLASEKGHYPVARFLLQNGADVDAYDGESLTALGYAVLQNHGRLARYLMDHWNANITLRQLNGSTILHFAAGNGNIRLIRHLIDVRRLDVNATNNFGQTPLHDAVLRSKDPEVVQFLIEKGANIHARNKRGETPLHSAVFPSSLELSPTDIERRLCVVFDSLLAAGADINATNNEQQTALGLLIENNQMEAAQHLIGRGA